MALTHTTIRNLKPQQKPYKASNIGGLQLHVMPEGSKLWRGPDLGRQLKKLRDWFR